MDMQRIFDTVASHLLKQNKRAIHVEESSGPHKLMFVTPDGLRDSIGCLIPMGLYDPRMEGYAFKGKDTFKQHTTDDGLKLLRNALEANGVYVTEEEVLRLLTDLQSVHDNHEPEFWPDRLRATARTWRLSSGVVDLIVSRREMGAMAAVRPARRVTVDDLLARDQERDNE